MHAGIRFGELPEYEGRETKRWKEWLAAQPERQMQSVQTKLKRTDRNACATKRGAELKLGLYKRIGTDCAAPTALTVFFAISPNADALG